MSQIESKQEWQDKVKKVRSSNYWKQVSQPIIDPIELNQKSPGKDEVLITEEWGLVIDEKSRQDEICRIGLNDLNLFLNKRLGTKLKASKQSKNLHFELKTTKNSSRWNVSFSITSHDAGVTVSANSSEALLHACIYLSNYWSLRRNLYLPKEKTTIKPAFKLHLGADLWGGFSTTQAWIHGRENDANFLELARMGVNGVPIMTLLEDYVIDDPTGKFTSLINPVARKNRERLATLAKQSAKYGVYIFLMAYNPRMPADHQVFKDYPESKGASQSKGAFHTLCSSDKTTRQFLTHSWSSLFEEIPELGGILAISGGEGFYHCFMRSQNNAADCPHCSKRKSSVVVAELINDVASGIKTVHPDNLLVTWPYSAGTFWSGDRDQLEFINLLDPDSVIFQTELDKDTVEWRPAGYAKEIWDYSMSTRKVSERCLVQRKQCRKKKLPFSIKIECNNSIECLNVPYLPTLMNQLNFWEQAAKLRPCAVHSRWLFDGSCKSSSEELGYWTRWGQNSEYVDLKKTLSAIAERDYGRQHAKSVMKAWQLFSEAISHHPQLDYYVGTYFIGPAQPLLLHKSRLNELDDCFFGVFYWLLENATTYNNSNVDVRKPLFYTNPGFYALARRGDKQGTNVALDELKEMAKLWAKGFRILENIKEQSSKNLSKKFTEDYVLAGHLAYTWQSGANVEEFMRLRNIVNSFSDKPCVRAGHHKENMRDYSRMLQIAKEELSIAEKDLKLIHNVDFLDLSLRLDMGTESTETILKAKIKQIKKLIDKELPEWKRTLSQW